MTIIDKQEKCWNWTRMAEVWNSQPIYLPPYAWNGRSLPLAFSRLVTQSSRDHHGISTEKLRDQRNEAFYAQSAAVQKCLRKDTSNSSMKSCNYWWAGWLSFRELLRNSDTVTAKEWPRVKRNVPFLWVWMLSSLVKYSEIWINCQTTPRHTKRSCNLPNIPAFSLKENLVIINEGGPRSQRTAGWRIPQLGISCMLSYVTGIDDIAMSWVADVVRGRVSHLVGNTVD